MSRFRSLGAVWEAGDPDAPHVKTSLGGSHVDKYFNSDVIVARPDLTAEIVQTVLLPEMLHRNAAPDWVVGYAPFGLFLAHAAAHALKARCAYSDPAVEYDTYFDIQASESVLVVADDMYSGRSVLRTVEKLESRNAIVLPAVFCLVNLSGKTMLGPREIVSVGTLQANIYPGDACPLCEHGSTALTPRPNWSVLSASAAATGSLADTEARPAS